VEGARRDWGGVLAGRARGSAGGKESDGRTGGRVGRVEVDGWRTVVWGNASDGGTAVRAGLARAGGGGESSERAERGILI
jgi:hypothetical protein